MADWAVDVEREAAVSGDRVARWDTGNSVEDKTGAQDVVFFVTRRDIHYE